MQPTPHISATRRFVSLWQSYVPPVLVCSCVLSIPAVPELHFKTGSAAVVVHLQPARPEHRLRTLPVDSAAELQDRLDREWSATGEGVPGLAPDEFPADLDQLPVGDRKQVFLRSLLPHVLDHNGQITEARDRLAAMSEETASGAELDETDRRFLSGLVDRYRLGVEIALPGEQIRALMDRVDVVPPSIALAQAAIESAWGTSRFTRLGNNLFGQWVFDRDRGIAPLRRPHDANYSLARFQNMGDAVDAYLRNLNGHYAYEEFRRLRRQMRDAGGSLDPYRLAGGLSSYSTRGEEYVREVRSVIRGNNLTRYDQARLVQVGAPPTLL